MFRLSFSVVMTYYTSLQRMVKGLRPLNTNNVYKLLLSLTRIPKTNQAPNTKTNHPLGSYAVCHLACIHKQFSTPLANPQHWIT